MLCFAQSKAPLPYPAIPDTLTTISERLDFLLTHFWEGFPFNDTSILMQQQGEQRFVDFVSLLNQTDSTTARHSVRAFGDSIAADSRRRQHYEYLAERYLTSEESPVRNTATYHLLQWAMPAADISYTDDTGRRQRLFDADGDSLLVVFYDPHCDRCSQLLEDLRTLERQSCHLRVVKIDTDRNEEAMARYYLPSLPVLYLLDSQRRVLLKTTSLQTLRTQF